MESKSFLFDLKMESKSKIEEVEHVEEKNNLYESFDY